MGTTAGENWVGTGGTVARLKDRNGNDAPPP